MFSDYVVSLVRTWVPLAVGAGLTWLAREAGIVLDEGTSAQATLVAVSVATGAYYALVRALEQRWPAFGGLLGQPAAPSYRPLDR